MQRTILFSKEARDKLLKGVNVIADAVSVTLGPSGKNVLIGGSYIQDFNTYHLPTRVTKDGVSVSREIMLDDQTENRGVMLIREASEKTMSMCGDGTTTTCVLARAIVNEGMKLVEAGANPMELKKGIDKAVDYVVEELKKIATPIGSDINKIRQIATIAANNDSEIGDLVAKAFEKIGNDGVIDIEESLTDVTEVKLTDGVKIDRGWLIPNFNTNKSKNECELLDPLILLTDKTISKISQIQKFVEHCNKNNKPFFVCCNDMDGEALAFLVINAAKQAIKCCVVKTPGFGASKIEEMEDLAISTGATLISDLKGTSLERATMSLLGSAKKIVVSKDQTVIVEGGKHEKDYEEYLVNLKINHAGSGGEEKEKLEKRIARLTGGIAVISVGGVTETEMKERKDRVDDSIRATKSAIAEGFVAGGGSAFFNINGWKQGVNSDGYLLVLNILQEPLKQICLNAGVDFSEKIKLLSKDKDSPFFEYNGLGYNAKTDKVEDLIQAGVIDPVKVLRCSLQNAASVATIILTVETTIVNNL